MQLLFWAFLPSSYALFFNLDGGGCSCPSNCGSPPPTNFGCRLMCSGQMLGCQQQQTLDQTFNQPAFAQPNYGLPASLPAFQQPYTNNYQSQLNAYVQAPPQFSTYQQQQPPAQQITQPQPYIPQAPSRFVDNYAAAPNRQPSGGFGTRPPQAPQIYKQVTVIHEPKNPLPASFVSAVQPEPLGSPSTSYESSESAHSQEVRLLPPEQPTPVQPVAPQQQSTSYVGEKPISSFGKSTEGAGELMFSLIPEKISPDEIAKSIEESYEDSEGDLMEQVKITPTIQKETVNEVLTNQILPNVNYVTTANALPAIQETLEEMRPVSEKPYVTEYALGHINLVSTKPTQSIVATERPMQYKTLTRGEGLTSQETSNESNYVEKPSALETTLPPDVLPATEDYVAEEKKDEATDTEGDETGYNRKLRQPKETVNVKETRHESTTTEVPVNKRSESREQSAFKCNSPKLRRIMEDKMTISAPVSKQLIYAEATNAFPGLSLDVICSKHSFSYIVVTSPIYCEHRKSPLTCFAFFQP